jgi:hypothetical protein
MTPDACTKYETAAELTILPNGNECQFPPDHHCLYYLGRILVVSRSIFDAALASGEINPNMSREQAQALAHRAELTIGDIVAVGQFQQF